MKLTTFSLSIILSVIFGFSLQAQILNQSAAWPNAAWALTGTYTAGGLINNPTITSSYLL